MKLVTPVIITDATLVSSTVAENDYPTWSGASTYALADRVIKNHKIYESLQASNTNHDPEATASASWWLYVSSTNRWKMLDQTTNSKTSATSSIVVELQPGEIINAVGAIQLEGQTIKVEMLDGSTVVYSQTKSIDNSQIFDWYDYLFEPFEFATIVVFDDLPAYLNGKVRITISGGGTVACGGVVLGRAYTLGVTLEGASAGIKDYSKKDTNTFGVTSLIERSYSDRASLRFKVDTNRTQWLKSLLAGVRATLALYIGEESDTALFASLAIYGIYRDFQIEIPGRLQSYCSIELEGVI